MSSPTARVHAQAPIVHMFTFLSLRPAIQLVRCRRAHQATDEVDVQGVTASAGDDVSLQRGTEQRQITNQIHEFVARGLIRESGPGEKALRPNPKRIVDGRATGQSGLPQRVELVGESPRPSRCKLCGKPLAAGIKVHDLGAQRGMIKRDDIGRPKHLGGDREHPGVLRCEPHWMCNRVNTSGSVLLNDTRSGQCLNARSRASV